MDYIVGVVEKVNDQSGPNNKWQKRSFKVNGTWYGAFLNKENTMSFNAVREGDTVKLGYSQNGKFYNAEEVHVTGAQPVSVAAALPGASVIPDKDLRITYLSCRNSALEFLTLAQAAGALKLSGKKDLDQLEAMLIEYTEQFMKAVLSISPDQFVEDANADEAVATEEKTYKE